MQHESKTGSLVSATHAGGLIALLALAVGHSALTSTQQSSATPDYRELSNKVETYSNFNVETTRGLAIDGLDVYSINTHGSRLVRFDLSAPDFPRTDWPTAHHPIAMGLWEGRALVLGGSTYALFFHDAVTGEIETVVDLASVAPEPGDLVIDTRRDMAWITSMGKHRVVRVDLNDPLAAPDVWEIPSLKPRFLEFVAGDTPTDPDYVYVTPLLSGNNSTVVPRDEFEEMDARIVDLDLHGDDLPDEDLFRIAADAVSGSAPEVVAKGVGTTLTDHGRNPVTGDYWVLSVDLLNKDAALDTEPKINGEFTRTEVVVLPDPVGASLPLSPTSFVRTPLDDFTSVAELEVVSNPWDLYFHSSGLGAVSSPTGDSVRFLRSADASSLGEVQLSSGSIPRSIDFFKLNATLEYMLVYCWGTNKIEVFQVLPTIDPTPVTFLDLGHDPAPTSVRHGRELFYDADLSKDSKSTCGSCHVGGEYDGLAWDISDDPVDRKDVMVTQSLKSIEDTFPYHWRGERNLLAFNSAFVGLLGGDRELEEDPDDEFEHFRDFIFSMQHHANPNQDRTRRLVDVPGETGSAIQGQLEFYDTQTFAGGFSCGDCHSGPAGSRNEFVQNDGELATFRHFEVAHLRDLAWKDRPTLPAPLVVEDPYDDNLTSVTLDRSAPGYGVLHNGRFENFASLLTAVQAAAAASTNTQEDDFSDQVRDDIVSFLRQFDTGLAPSAHLAYLLSAATLNAPQSTVEDDIEDLLMAQAALPEPWCGVVVHGTYPVLGQDRFLSWEYVPASDHFVSDDQSLAPQTLADFVTQAGNGYTYTVLGTAPGNQRILSTDIDDDGLPNLSEAALGLEPYVQDYDGDGFPDGYEDLHGSDPKVTTSGSIETTPPNVTLDELYVTTNQAILRLTSDEPVRYRVTWWADADVARDYEKSYEVNQYVLEDMVVLRGLIADSDATNQTHTVEVEAWDYSGNLASPGPSLSGIVPTEIQDSSNPMIGNVPIGIQVGLIKSLEIEADRSALTGANLAVDLTVRARVVFPGALMGLNPPLVDAPLDGWRVVAQVLLEDVNDTVPGEWIVSDTFVLFGDPDGFLYDPDQDDVFEDYDVLGSRLIVSQPTSAFQSANHPDGPDPGGETLLTFRQPLSQGDQAVQLNVVAVAKEEFDSVPATGTEKPKLPNLAGWIFQETANGVRSLTYNDGPGN